MGGLDSQVWSQESKKRTSDQMRIMPAMQTLIPRSGRVLMTLYIQGGCLHDTQTEADDEANPLGYGHLYLPQVVARVEVHHYICHAVYDRGGDEECLDVDAVFLCFGFAHVPDIR